MTALPQEAPGHPGAKAGQDLMNGSVFPLHVPETESKRDDVESAADEVEFDLPDFDEETYIREEIRDARLAVLTLGFAFGWAVVTRLTEIALENTVLAFFTVFVGFVVLRRVVMALGIDAGDLDAKKWLAIGAIYFFSWLGFWTLLLNPPFSGF